MLLLQRREYYEAEVPDGVIYLTAGVDTQDNRFEVEVVGWGIGKESWGIRYQKIYGDPQARADMGRPGRVPGPGLAEEGRRPCFYPLATCMDSGGHFPDEVLRFCKDRADRRNLAHQGPRRHGCALHP